MGSNDYMFHSLPRVGQSDGPGFVLVGPEETNHANVQLKKRQILRRFQQRCSILLTRSNQNYLLGILKEYQMYQQIGKLVDCLRVLLDTPAKLDLLRDIRFFISTAQLAQFDRTVPLQHMAHPWRDDAAPATLPRSGGQRVRVLRTPQRTPKVHSKHVHDYTEVLSSEAAPLKVVTLNREEGEALGFSIRGGSEHGLGIFISEVDMHSAADKAGLDPGDNIMEVNSVAFDNIGSGGAVTVLTGSRKLKMIVRKLGKIPGLKSAKEKVAWYDVDHDIIVSGNVVDHGRFHFPPHTLDSPDRPVDLSRPHDRPRALGFNIRGGAEYGLGLYVSRIDEGSLAEERGLQLGDQIMEINGHSCHRVTHTKAVYYIQAQRRLQLTVRGICQYPAFKEVFAEYKWTDTTSGQVTKTRSHTRRPLPSSPARPWDLTTSSDHGI